MVCDIIYEMQTTLVNIEHLVEFLDRIDKSEFRKLFPEATITFGKNEIILTFNDAIVKISMNGAINATSSSFRMKQSELDSFVESIRTKIERFADENDIGWTIKKSRLKAKKYVQKGRPAISGKKRIFRFSAPKHFKMAHEVQITLDGNDISVAIVNAGSEKLDKDVALEVINDLKSILEFSGDVQIIEKDESHIVSRKGKKIKRTKVGYA